MTTIKSRGATGVIFASIFFALTSFAFYAIRLSHVSMKVGELMEIAINSPFIKEYGNLELRKHYTGIGGLDFGLSFLVTAFLPGVLDIDRGSKLQQAHFLVSFFPIIAILCVEAGRARNKWSLLYFTSIWAFLYQTVGGAVILALYHLAYMKTSSNENYWNPSSRAVSLPYAKALLPSLILGYLLPTIALYIPYENIFTTQAVVAFWQPSPLLVNVLILVFSALFSIGYTKPKQTPEGTTSDVKYLQHVYLFSFAVAAASHWLAITALLFSKDPNITFFHAIWPRKDLVLATGRIHTMHEGLLYILQIDFWVIFGSSLIWAYLAILDTNRVARAYVAPAQAFAVIGLNTVLFGPAATVAAIWYSRESTLAQLQQKSKAK